jgi:protein arginine kinase activator
MPEESDDQNSVFADIDPAHAEADLTCPHCGTTIVDLNKDGRMGCAHCYDTFRDVIQRALVMLHGSSRHIGKTL